MCVFCRRVLSQQIAVLALSNPDQRAGRLRDKDMEISATSFGKLQRGHTLTNETCDFSLPLRHHSRRRHFDLAIHNLNCAKYRERCATCHTRPFRLRLRIVYRRLFAQDQ